MTNNKKINIADLSIKDYDSVKQWNYSLAKKWVHDNLVPLNIKTKGQYREYIKSGKLLPKYFPKYADSHFTKKGTWISWYDFLNKEPFQFLNYQQAKAIVQKAGITSSRNFLQWKQRPKEIPAQPHLHYKDWVSWYDFLATERHKPNPTASAKLDERKVRIIKHQLTMGVSAAALGRLFGVSDMQIIRIKRGENWGHISL